MAHGFKEIKGNGSPNVKSGKVQVKPCREGKGIGSRRMFSTQFKLQVLDSYRQDADCRGNQRATARKYGIHRRQIQKWLQMETNLRCSGGASSSSSSESGETALNLAAGRSRQRDDTCTADCLTVERQSSSSSVSETTSDEIGSPSTVDDDDVELNVDTISDSEEEVLSDDSIVEQERALDFTCAALSRRRFYSADFKSQVIRAFRYDATCRGDRRAVALKFGLHRRQIDKWLNREEALTNDRQSTIEPSTPPPCLDLSRKRRQFDDINDECPTKKFYLDLDVEKPTSVQETALCLVKPPPPICEVTSSLDLVYRPQCGTGGGSPCNYWACCAASADSPLTAPAQPPPSPFYDCWSTGYSCPYACITSRLHHDAVYYKQAVKDINLYTPLFS